MEPLASELGTFAEGLIDDYDRNIAFLRGEEPADERQRALVRLALALGTLAHDAFDGIVVLLLAGRLRAAFVLVRSLIEYHVRLRYAIKVDPDVVRWESASAALRELGNLYEPDEWADEAQEQIVAVLGADDRSDARTFREMCEALETAEEKENDYRWARSAWLVEGAFARGEAAVLFDPLEHPADPAADARTILFEAVWYLLDIMDSFGMIRGWAYGAVKARQDAIKLYLAGKPAESASL